MSQQTYKADTMFRALQQIQDDLGPDAVVLSAREIPAGPLWEKWKRTSVEVIAIPAHEYTGKAPKKPAQSPAALVDDPSEIEWVGDNPMMSPPAEPAPKTRSWAPAHLNREQATAANHPATARTATQPLNRQPVEPVAPPAEKRAAPADEGPRGLRKNQQILLAQGVDGAFLERTLHMLTASIGPAKLQDEEISHKYLSQVLEAELQDAKGLALKPPARIVSLVGPSGCGKTSLAAKMAVYYGQQGKQVVWVCADTVRTGAIAEARLYAETLGIPLALVYTPAQLPAILEEHAGADLILVDTPGYNPMDEGQMADLGSFLTGLPPHCNLLVVPAPMKELDALRMAAALGLFGLNGLAVTKLDETASYGSVYNLARKMRIPLAYFTSGKTAVDHFQLASAQHLVAALFEKGGFR